MENNELQGKAKNLGQVAAMIYSATPPTNLRILWYDTTNNVIKKYNISESEWQSIGGSAEVATIPNSLIDTLS